jgi:hypothetical protein
MSRLDLSARGLPRDATARRLRAGSCAWCVFLLLLAAAFTARILLS